MTLSVQSCSKDIDDINIKRVIILGVDGLSAEGFQKSEHPNLDTLLQDGVLSLNTVVEAPSITLPNWTSHLTSGGTEQHRVTSNSWTINNQNIPPIVPAKHILQTEIDSVLYNKRKFDIRVLVCVKRTGEIMIYKNLLYHHYYLQ